MTPAHETPFRERHRGRAFDVPLTLPSDAPQRDDEHEPQVDRESPDTCQQARGRGIEAEAAQSQNPWGFFLERRRPPRIRDVAKAIVTHTTHKRTPDEQP